ncbi:hypothetical protein AB4305_14180 [Nocardia sp. 2YAB30]|uniref:hypothetical protein n=1 Tax=unclassified Nocardia TaxID=2637762 RepID=UPI003F9C8978
MSIEFGRPAADLRGAVAQVRGGSAGAISGVISIAAHGWVSDGMPPTATALVLLTAGSTVIGAMVAGLALLRDTSTGLAAALVTGQVLGHLTMGFSSGHLHHGDAQLTPIMLTAHLFAAVAAAIVIRGAEAAYRVGTAVLARVIPVRQRAPIVAGPAPLRTAHRDRVILRVLAAQSLRTRGPPLPVGI